MSKYQIPFDNHGNQQHYPEPSYRPTATGYQRIEPEWRDNTEFDDVLRFSEYRRGRSAAYFIFQNNDGKERTMFLKEFEEAVPFMERGIISGRFTFIKRGQNYGIKLLKATA